MSSFSNLTTGRRKVETIPGYVSISASSPASSSVSSSSSQVVASNASRKGLVIINTGSANVSLGFGVPAVVNSGVTLVPNGVYEMDYWLYTTSAVNAISPSSTTIAIQEFS